MNKQQIIIDKALWNVNTLLSRLKQKTAKVKTTKNGTALVLPDGAKRELKVFSAMTPAQLTRHLPALAAAGICVFADYLTPGVAETLLHHDVAFADTAGNMHLRYGDSVILVQHCPKPPELQRQERVNRGWGTAGLKIVFLLLVEPAALNWTYRRIAAMAGCSLGAVNNAISDLLEQYWLQKMDGILRWTDKQKTIARWCETYQRNLLPKIGCVRYAGDTLSIPDGVPLLWSGEKVAADLGLLNTSNAVGWRWGNIAKAVSRNRWREDPKGNIEVREAFWPDSRDLQGQIPWLLIYADLLATNDSRCLEAATTIYQRYLETMT